MYIYVCVYASRNVRIENGEREERERETVVIYSYDNNNNNDDNNTMINCSEKAVTRNGM